MYFWDRCVPQEREWGGMLSCVIALPCLPCVQILRTSLATQTPRSSLTPIWPCLLDRWHFMPTWEHFVFPIEHIAGKETSLFYASCWIVKLSSFRKGDTMSYEGLTCVRGGLIVCVCWALLFMCLQLASTIMQKQRSNPKDPYASNWLERLRQIKRIKSKVMQESTKSTEPSGQGHPPGPFLQHQAPSTPVTEDFTDFV